MKKFVFCVFLFFSFVYVFSEDVFSEDVFSVDYKFGFDKYLTLSEMKSLKENEDVFEWTDNPFEFAFKTKKKFIDYDCILTCKYIKNSNSKYEIEDNIFTVDFFGLLSEIEVLYIINIIFGDNVLYKPNGNFDFIVSTCEKLYERKELNLTVTPFMNQYILSYSWRLYK